MRGRFVWVVTALVFFSGLVRFYIGCDLCSNWFHGTCVNITEEQARFIDSYICEDCRKQQENTSEELYCLCRTPYDENQWVKGRGSYWQWKWQKSCVVEHLMTDHHDERPPLSFKTTFFVKCFPSYFCASEPLTKDHLLMRALWLVDWDGL